MSPILGIWASQNYTRYQLPTSYESIATVTVGSGGASSITFSSIPATYTHLQLRGILRSNPTYPDGEYGFIRMNGDSGANYSYHYLAGNGSAAFSGGGTDSSGWGVIQLAPNQADLANDFGPNIYDILDYTNTSKYKTFRGLNGNDRNGSGSVVLSSGSWRNTAAISSITIVPGGGTAWLQYSTFALYGIKGD